MPQIVNDNSEVVEYWTVPTGYIAELVMPFNPALDFENFQIPPTEIRHEFEAGNPPMTRVTWCR